MSNQINSQKVISQAKLKKYLELAAFAEEFDLLKKEIIDLMVNKTRIQAGPLVPFLKTHYKSSVSWKDLYTKVVGEGAVKKILDDAPKDIPVNKLIVADRNNPVEEKNAPCSAI